MLENSLNYILKNFIKLFFFLIMVQLQLLRLLAYNENKVISYIQIYNSSLN